MKYVYALLGWLALMMLGQVNTLFAQADFVATPTSGCNPLIVTFADQTPNAVAWSWDFGNGSTSTLQSPGLIYNTSGTYTVQLIVTLSNGSTDTVTKSNYIQVFQGPTAGFTATPNAICEGDSVLFTDQTILGSGSNLSVNWDFGDGFTGSNFNPSHTYQSAGVYNIVYAVTDENGCQDVLVDPAVVTVDAVPDATFSLNAGFSCTAPLFVQFASQSSAQSLQHRWYFGDGDSSTLVNPQHVYLGVGSFDVTHIVSSNVAGCADTFVISNAVTIGDLQPEIFVAPGTLCAGSPVSFSTNISPGATFDWDLSGGVTSTSPTPQNTYSGPGAYPIMVTVTDANNCSADTSITINVGDPPVVDFSSPDTFNCSPPHSASFTDLSTNAISWLWDFGDGNTSTLQNPTHTYNSLGSFDVSLTVMSPDSCFETLTRPGYIVVAPPGAGFYGVPAEGCAPLNVHFNDQTISGSGIVSWSWTFGDGGTSTQQNPQHTYLNAGNYTVSLIVTDATGCSDTLTRPSYIGAGDQPIADFEADTTFACLDEQIGFTNLSTNSLFCEWDFGDGGTSTVCNPTHVYADTGFFDVTLIVTNNGCADTLELEDYIYVNPPLVDFGADTTQSCELPLLVTFSDSSYGANQWLWDFGDGDSSTVQNPTHTYTSAGNFFATLLVTDTVTGCTDYVSMGINILPTTADFEVLDSVGCVPFQVQFFNLSQNFTSFSMDYGIGPLATPFNTNPTKTYQTPGVYDVTMFVSNSLGCADTLYKPDLITVLGPVVNIAADPDSGCLPLLVQFTDSVVPTSPIVSYLWDFGDGSTDIISNPQHPYSVSGSYPVSLTVTDMDSCSATANLPVNILVTDPAVDFFTQYQEDCPYNPVKFNSLANGVNLTYLWDFGDGGTATTPNPKHTYSSPGVYTVSLTVTDVNGCTATEIKTNYMTIIEMVASLAADTTASSCPPLLVNFTGSATLSNLSSFEWDFGDGAVSAQADPSHIYAIPGIYDVSLIVESETGCIDSVEIPDFIELAGPWGTISFSPDSGCPPLAVTLEVSATNTALYQFDMDDGTLVSTLDSFATHVYNLPGNYLPQVVLNDGLGCDVLITSPDPVVIHPLPQLDFSGFPTVVCNQGLVQFSDLTSSLASISDWLWDFGDGTSDTVQNPTHFYSTLGTYDVTLSVTTVDGCQETLFFDDYIAVVPSPTAGIQMPDSNGCEPFLALFNDASTIGSAGLASWVWDFGDGSNSDSGANVSHVYADAGLFTAQMIVTDSLGCADTASHGVEVFPLPDPNFTVIPDSFGCAPFVCEFIDQTPTAVAWQWDFGDGSPLGTGSNPGHLYQNDGVYTVTLWTTDLNGCTDSLVKVEYINLDHPDAGFINDSPVCPGVLVNFADSTLSDTSLVSWQWDFGDGQTGTGDPTTHTYAVPGFYDVTMIVTDYFGCSDTVRVDSAVDVRINEIPLPPDIEYVTVLDNNTIKIAWEIYANPLLDFQEYALFRADNGGGLVEIFSTTDINQLEYTDVEVNTLQNVYCYRLQIRNYCGLGSELAASREHCSIELATTSLPERIQLDWNAYEGWSGGVARYEIYRVISYDMATASFLGSVPGNTTTYIDREMNCEEAFSYRVVALQANGTHVSRSDTARGRPIHAKIQDPTHMVVASVVNNEHISLSWEFPPVLGLEEYVVQKDNGSGFVDLIAGTVASGTVTYEDFAVDVSAQPYSYRLLAIDTCGDFTPSGRIARSIHLQAEYNNARVNLEWTPYIEWESGVERYVIEVFIEASNTWQVQGMVTGNETNFLDENADLGQAVNCYRIQAYEVNGNQAESYSNEVCVVLQPRIYAPNAFSPNNDGKNDRFVLKGLFINQFRMDIYNRWGEKIYETYDIEEGWDGRLRDGTPAPEGVYVYVAYSNGYGEDAERRAGTVTLYR